jgi:chemotaxis protein CheX
MDAKLINPVISSVLNILKTVASTKGKVLEPFLKEDAIALGDISGTIELSGAIRGLIAISFAEKAILSVVTKMFGEKVKEINPEVKDAVGELTNMIAGQSTQQLQTIESSLQAKLAVVLVGKDHKFDHFPDQPIIAVPIETKNGSITLEFSFNAKK